MDTRTPLSALPPDWDDFVDRVRASSDDASPIVRECQQGPSWKFAEDLGRPMPRHGCGWWRPATEEEYGSIGECPSCGGRTATRALLSRRDEVRVLSVASGVPTTIAMALT